MVSSGEYFVTPSPKRPRQSLWKRILDALSDEIDDGTYPAGAKLPTEAELASRFSVNRHTVRRALKGLTDDGRIHVRRGSGAFVTQGRFDYEIGPRTQMTRNLESIGISASRRWLRVEQVAAPIRVAEVLEIDPSAPIVVGESVGLANGVPITYAHSSYPLERLPGIVEALTEESSVTAAFQRIGIPDYERLWTRLRAERPGQVLARHLQMPEAHPVLLSECVNRAPDGRLIEYGRTWFCSDRVQLVIDPTRFSEEAIPNDGAAGR